MNSHPLVYARGKNRSRPGIPELQFGKVTALCMIVQIDTKSLPDEATIIVPPGGKPQG
jgi:hypothetical protein